MGIFPLNCLKFKFSYFPDNESSGLAQGSVFLEVSGCPSDARQDEVDTAVAKWSNRQTIQMSNQMRSCQQLLR